MKTVKAADPLLEGVDPAPVIPLEWSCPCGGSPTISQGQMVDWTWPWKIKALHMFLGVALLAP